MKREGGFGWSELIAGILLILLGVFTFARPESMLSGLVVVYGIIAIALGIEDIVVYVRLSRFTGFGPMLSLIAGILSVMCGIMLLANPNVGKWALTILMPIWFIAHCISGLTRVNLVRLIGNSFYYYFSLLLNILGLILGFISSLVAFFLEWGLYDFLASKIAQIDTLQLITVVPFAECIEIVAIAYAITGFIVGVFGSMLSIRKFLRV